MPLRDWVSVYQDGGLQPDQIAVLTEVGRMLDDYRPPLLDIQASVVRVQGHNWTLKNAVVIQLVPENQGDVEFDEDGLEIVVGADEAIIAWLTMHEHVYASDGSPERPWTTIVADAAAGFIRADYEVVDYYRGKRLVKTVLRDISDPQSARTLSETGSLLGLATSWLPGLKPSRVVRSSPAAFGIERGSK